MECGLDGNIDRKIHNCYLCLLWGHSYDLGYLNPGSPPAGSWKIFCRQRILQPNVSPLHWLKTPGRFFCLGKLSWRRCYKYNFGQTRCRLSNLICVSLQYNVVPIPWLSIGDFVSSQNVNGRWWLYSVSVLTILVLASWVILWLSDKLSKDRKCPKIVITTYQKLNMCSSLFNCFTCIYLFNPQIT